MKLMIYKGFNIAFLDKLDARPLVEGDTMSKIDVLAFNKKTRKKLERELIDLEDSDEVWITYQEYSLIKTRVEEAAEEDGLEVVIYRNNLYPDYYPIEFSITEELAIEIVHGLDGQELGTLSAIEIVQTSLRSIMLWRILMVNISEVFSIMSMRKMSV